jgi:hypothetical protein
MVQVQGDDSLLHVPQVLALHPEPMERAVSRWLGIKKQTLKIDPPSSRRNVGPCQHHALKNTERNVVVMFSIWGWKNTSRLKFAAHCSRCSMTR